VLFLNKSTFTQFQQERQGKVWCEPGEELNPDCISVTVKHNLSKMFWEYFFWNELRPIVSLNSSVIGKTHAETIQKYVVPTLQKYFPHDNKIF